MITGSATEDEGVAGRAPNRRFAITTGARGEKLAAVGALVLVLLLALLPFLVDRGPIQVLFSAMTMLALAQFWNLLAGYAGLVSVGQQGFVGLGGYFLFAAATFAGIDPLLAVPLAGIFAALVALPSAWLIFRLQGAYFAIGTWVLAEVFRLIAAQIKPLGGGTGASLSKTVADKAALTQAIVSVTGMRAPAARDVAAYWLALAVAVLATALVYGLLRSRRGLALNAIRDDQSAASSLGVDPFRLKLMVYALCAFGAGMVGALIYLQKARISPDAAFSVLDWTAYILFIVIIGGVATVEGPFVGVLVFFFLQEELSEFGAAYLVLLGAVAIVVMVFFPKGLWGSLAERFDLHVFPVRRRLTSTIEPAATSTSVLGRIESPNSSKSKTP
jgi:branched-chain amino acid transport system permease protein